jgi:CheY-like chemotaxis protein
MGLYFESTMNPTPKLVFIIDDDEIYLRFMTGHFAQLGGYKTEVFNTAEEAISALKSANPYLIILDHHFSYDPPTTGLDHLDQIKKLRPKVPVIYLTGVKEEELEQQALKKKVYRFIRKNDAFLVHLRNALDGLMPTPKKKGFFARLFGK